MILNNKYRNVYYGYMQFMNIKNYVQDNYLISKDLYKLL